MTTNKRMLFLIGVSLLLAGCGSNTQTQTEQTQTSSGSEYSKTYEIKENIDSNYSLNGLIVSENTLTLVSSKAGMISSLNCQPGSRVSKGQTIATITPDTSDPGYQNYIIQRGSIQSQIGTLNNTMSSTSSNFDIQISQLKSQKDNNNVQIKILQDNIANQKKQGTLTSGDISIQIKSLEDQIDYLKQSKQKLEESIASLEQSKNLVLDSKSKDLDKINQNIVNLKKQMKTSIDSAFESIDKLYGITDANLNKNNFGDYLGSKDQLAKVTVKNDFLSFSSKLKNFDSMSNDEISIYLNDVGNYVNRVATNVNMSVATTQLTQTQIDGYYSTYNNLSNTMFTYKTNFDNLIASIKTTSNTYDNQVSGTLNTSKLTYENNIKTIESNILSLQNNIDNIKNNKSASSDLAVDTALNSLQSQLQSLTYSNENIDKQLSALEESKNIQLNSLKSQLVTLNQNLQTISTNLAGETITATKSGQIKAKPANQGNKVSAGASICQITPDDAGGLKIQIYSPSKLELGNIFDFSKDGQYLGTGELQFELPYKDQMTQNYIYETKLYNKTLNEGDKLSINISTKGTSDGVWVPIEFVSPRLGGYFVEVQTSSGYEEKKIDVGQISDGHIRVLSGVNQNDVLVR